MDDFNKYRTLGKYQVSNICLESYPCQHYVIDSITKEKKLLDGREIYALLSAEGVYDTHFEHYKK